jgi:ubiquinol-cytochrome c reductase cytochrome c subunit
MTGRTRPVLKSRFPLRAFLLLSGVTLVPAAFALRSPAARPAAAEAVRPHLAQAQDVNLGRRLYEQRCASCHGLGGGGTGQGPPILGLGPAVYDFMLSTGRMPLDRPVAQAPRNRPAFGPEEIRALTAYLTSLQPGGVPIPDVRPEQGDVAVGQRLHQLHCAACHGSTGNGGAVGDSVAPGLHAATALQVAEAIRIGPGSMPVFGAETLSQAELNSLVRYVLTLRDPVDRGGAGLGHVGPIVEGFVALLFGLGALVVVTRLIGERS